MNTLLVTFFASICAAGSSLCFRKSADSPGSPSGYLIPFYLVAFLLSFFVYPETWSTPVNYVLLGIGACAGCLSALLMILIARALQHGPAGLTFAILNASAIFPGMVLFLTLGQDFGFACTWTQVAGMVLVLVGLFMGAKKESEGKKGTWLKYAFGCFFAQICILTLMQARCILFGCPEWHMAVEADDVWFMPGQFGAALVMQMVLYWKDKPVVRRREFGLGMMGGIANFTSNMLLLVATKYALPLEKGIIFPVFAVAAMVLSNVWANRLYKENFNLKTNVLCSFGIFMAV